MQSISHPMAAKIIDYSQQSHDIFTLQLRLTDAKQQADYQFVPGQFNMLYLFGVGEVPMSITSDPESDSFYAHTIRRVGRVTEAFSQQKVGDHIGLRGPFGRGWPLLSAQGKDILIITGGLGCAPSVSIIKYIMKRRKHFGRLIILQGIKHSDDLLFRAQYEQWAKVANTEIGLAADVSKPGWPWHTGLITELLDQIKLNTSNTLCMMCGPQAMMRASVKKLKIMGLAEEAMYLSLERNMECAIGHCGHCQLGGKFVCKDGPIFCYPEVKALLGKKGF